MLLLLITDLRWNIPGYAQMWRAQKRISNSNDLWQVTAVTHSSSLLVSLFLPSCPFWPAVQPWELYISCLGLKASQPKLFQSLTVVTLHVETMTKGVRKAGRSWDKESKQHCSSSSIKLWGRFFWSHFSSWKTCCNTFFDSFLRNSCKPFCRGQFIFASIDGRYYWISNVDCKFKFWWTVSAICSTNKRPLIAESNRAPSYLLLCCYNCLPRNTNTTHISLVI